MQHPIHDAIRAIVETGRLDDFAMPVKFDTDNGTMTLDFGRDLKLTYSLVEAMAELLDLILAQGGRP